LSGFEIDQFHQFSSVPPLMENIPLKGVVPNSFDSINNNSGGSSNPAVTAHDNEDVFVCNVCLDSGKQTKCYCTSYTMHM